MDAIMLQAIERPKKSGKFREIGFVPGIIYGDDIPVGTQVKFDEKALNKILSAHGSNANITIDYNGKNLLGFIKEVQRKPMTGKMMHLDVQIVSKEHEIHRQIPIVFNGDDDLKNKQLQLQILKAEVNVFGKIALMPDTIFVDVSEKELGDSITYDDFDLNKLIKNENEDMVYAMINNIRIQPVEEVAVVAETE